MDYGTRWLKMVMEHLQLAYSLPSVCSTNGKNGEILIRECMNIVSMYYPQQQQFVTDFLASICSDICIF